MNGIQKFFEDLKTVDEPVNEGREVADAALSNGGAEDIITALKEAYAEEVEAWGCRTTAGCVRLFACRR